MSVNNHMLNTPIPHLKWARMPKHPNTTCETPKHSHSNLVFVSEKKKSQVIVRLYKNTESAETCLQPQHLGSSCCNRPCSEPAECRTTAVGGEVDPVCITSMLGAHTQSKLMVSVSKMLKLLYEDADHIIRSLPKDACVMCLNAFVPGLLCCAMMNKIPRSLS